MTCAEMGSVWGEMTAVVLGSLPSPCSPCSRCALVFHLEGLRGLLGPTGLPALHQGEQRSVPVFCVTDAVP